MKWPNIYVPVVGGKSSSESSTSSLSSAFLAAGQEKLEVAADHPQDFCREEFVVAQASFVMNAVLFDELDKFSDLLGDNALFAKLYFQEGKEGFWLEDYLMVIA